MPARQGGPLAHLGSPFPLFGESLPAAGRAARGEQTSFASQQGLPCFCGSGQRSHLPAPGFPLLENESRNRGGLRSTGRQGGVSAGVEPWPGHSGTGDNASGPSTCPLLLVAAAHTVTPPTRLLRAPCPGHPPQLAHAPGHVYTTGLRLGGRGGPAGRGRGVIRRRPARRPLVPVAAQMKSG